MLSSDARAATCAHVHNDRPKAGDGKACRRLPQGLAATEAVAVAAAAVVAAVPSRVGDPAGATLCMHIYVQCKACKMRNVLHVLMCMGFLYS